MQIESPRPQSALVFWLAGAATVAAGAVLFWLFLGGGGSVPFEIANFAGQPEVFTHNKWVPVNRGDVLRSGDKIRTGEDTELDLLLRDKVTIRVKANSEVTNKNTAQDARLYLARGALLGATTKSFKGERMEITTPVSVAAVLGTLFLVEHKPEVTTTWVGVLQGHVEVRSSDRFAKESVSVGNLQRTVIGPNKKPEAPAKISRDDWLNMKESYELIQREANFEQKQQDLSKKVGNLFEHVFDHGTFYMPKFGFASREFVLDETTGEVTFDLDYDVFPRGSFAGIYIKTRDFDISKFEKLEFMIRRGVDKDYPEAFRIEFKSRGQVLRAFAYRDMNTEQQIKKDWRMESYPLSASKTTLVDEITFVFSHDQVGEFKKGGLQLRNLTLTPKKEEPKPAAVKPAVKPVQEAVPAAQETQTQPAQTEAQPQQPAAQAQEPEPVQESAPTQQQAEPVQF